MDREQLQKHHTEKRHDFEDMDTLASFIKETPHAKKNIYFRILNPLLTNKKLVLAFFVHTITAGLLPLLSVFIVQFLLRIVQEPGAQDGKLLLYAGGYAFLYTAFSIIMNQVYLRSEPYLTEYRMGKWLIAVDRITSMDFGLYENPKFMDFSQQCLDSLGGSADGLEGSLKVFFKAGAHLLSLLLMLVILALYSVWIPVVVVVYFLLYFFVRKKIADKEYEKKDEQNALTRKMENFANDGGDFRKGKDVRMFHQKERYEFAFAPLIEAYKKLLNYLLGFRLKFSIIEYVALVGIQFISFFVLVHQVQAGTIDLSTFVMLLTAISLLYTLVQTLANELRSIKINLKKIEDSMNFLDADFRNQGNVDNIPDEGSLRVEFQDVSFHYPGSEKLVLEKLNFVIHPGETLALVGVNGAGKSTIVKLICGLYYATSGRVLINGVDVKEYTNQALWSALSCVFQEVEPLALTVAENIACTIENIDRELVEDVLQQVGLWEKVTSSPKGIDTMMLKVLDKDGLVLSGGENQKLMLARGLYRRDARMIILDEPTASLDALAEQKLYEDFQSIMANKTALFISHRLASTRFCDRILLIDGGRIVQDGSHSQLVSEPGLYRDMFETQGKYYREEAKVDG